MFFRIVSDLHLELNPNWRLPILPEDGETTLLLAGDISTVDHLNYYDAFFDDVCSRFKTVVYIFGNHEYYKGSLTNCLNKYTEHFARHTNLKIFEKGVCEFDDVVVIAATLWTDVNNGNPYDKMIIGQKLNDYHHIRIGPNSEPYQKKLTPNDTYCIHKQHLEFITDKLEHYRSVGNKKIIVMSHHAPSSLSIGHEFRGSDTNSAYYSDLSELIFQYSPDIWCHGHCHSNFDYQLYDTRVICNPKGYAVHVFSDGVERHQNNNFDPLLRFEF